MSIVTKDHWLARTGCRWCRVCMLSSILAPSSSCSRSYSHKHTCTHARTHAAYCMRACARALSYTDAVYVPDTDAVHVPLHLFPPLTPHLVCATGLTLPSTARSLSLYLSRILSTTLSTPEASGGAAFSECCVGLVLACYLL